MSETSDAKEEQNMEQEELLSEKIYAQLITLAKEAKILKKEYAHLLKIGKKVKNIIKEKEKNNRLEIQQQQTIHTNIAKTSVNTIKRDSAKLKKEEEQESKLSKEEAIILQNMLQELHETYKHGETICKTDSELYNLLQEVYKKDLDDYQLESEDVKHA